MKRVHNLFTRVFDRLETRWLFTLPVVLFAVLMAVGIDPIASVFDHAHSIQATLVISIISIALGYFVIDKGANSFVEHSKLLAAKSGRGSGVVVLAVAFGTAVTEFGFTIAALVKGQQAVLYSTITASDLMNASLVIGMVVLVTISLAFKGRNMWSAVVPLAVATVLIAFGGWYGYTSLLAIAIVVCCGMAAWRFVKTAPSEAFAFEETEDETLTVYSSVALVLGLAWLIIGAVVFYDGSIALVTVLHAPKFLAGLAAGLAASAPELATLLPLAKRGEVSLAIVASTALASNALDSLVANTPGMWGWFDSMAPTHASHVQGASIMVATIVVALIFLFSGQRKGKMSRWMAAPLLVIFVISAILL